MDKNKAIRELQFFLRLLAFNNKSIPLIGIDGIFGNETSSAVAAFQALFGLEPNGVVDFTTWIRIFDEYIKITYSERDN
jgi:peptidoglycan hydrolase-like protein with peptidoglycan-binding domain